MSRRYIVKGYASSPTWSGCTWANSCTTLEAAKSLFARKVAASGTADVILLIDRQEHQVLESAGSDRPEVVADWYGW